MHAQESRPPVTLTRSSAPVPAPRVRDRAGGPSRSALWLLLPVGVLLLALLAGTGPDRDGPAPSLDAELVLLAERITVSQSGVLVLPVELRNRGAALQVQRAAAYASPVLEDPVVQAPGEVAAGGSRRFVALVAPDCRLLRAGSPLDLSASLLLKTGRGSVSRDLVLDLAADAEVRARVAGLCRR